MVVDALMRISRKEEVVWPWANGGPQQSPLGWMQILSLVDDRVGIKTGVGEVAAGELLCR
jgi:hypothetical protein